MHTDPVTNLTARLRALPQEAAPAPDPRLFTDLTAGAPGAKATPVVRPAPRLAAVALAAGLVAAACVALWLRPAGLTAPPVADVPPAQRALPPSAATNARLRSRSAELEASWRELARQPVRVQRLAHTERAGRLKARVGLLDASYGQLDADEYWQRRVDLLDALVTAERAERLQRHPVYERVRARAGASQRSAPRVYNPRVRN